MTTKETTYCDRCEETIGGLEHHISGTFPVGLPIPTETVRDDEEALFTEEFDFCRECSNLFIDVFGAFVDEQFPHLDEEAGVELDLTGWTGTDE